MSVARQQTSKSHFAVDRLDTLTNYAIGCSIAMSPFPMLLPFYDSFDSVSVSVSVVVIVVVVGGDQILRLVTC